MKMGASIKSVHFKKTVVRITFLSKLWYFQYKSKSTTILKETRFAQLSSCNRRTSANKLMYFLFYFPVSPGVHDFRLNGTKNEDQEKGASVVMEDSKKELDDNISHCYPYFLISTSFLLWRFSLKNGNFAHFVCNSSCIFFSKKNKPKY